MSSWSICKNKKCRNHSVKYLLFKSSYIPLWSRGVIIFVFLNDVSLLHRNVLSRQGLDGKELVRLLHQVEGDVTDVRDPVLLVP